MLSSRNLRAERNTGLHELALFPAKGRTHPLQNLDLGPLGRRSNAPGLWFFSLGPWAMGLLHKVAGLGGFFRLGPNSETRRRSTDQAF